MSGDAASLDARLVELNRQQRAMVASAVGGWRAGRNLGLIAAGLLVAGAVAFITSGEFWPTAVAFTLTPAILLALGSVLDRDTQAARELVLWASMPDRSRDTGPESGRPMAAFQPERDVVGRFLADGTLDTQTWVAAAEKLDDARQRNWNLVRAALFEATDLYVRNKDWRRFLADRRRAIEGVRLSARARRRVVLLTFVPALIWLVVSAIGVYVFGAISI